MAGPPRSSSSWGLWSSGLRRDLGKIHQLPARGSWAPERSSAPVSTSYQDELARLSVVEPGGDEQGEARGLWDRSLDPASRLVRRHGLGVRARRPLAAGARVPSRAWMPRGSQGRTPIDPVLPRCPSCGWRPSPWSAGTQDTRRRCPPASSSVWDPPLWTPAVGLVSDAEHPVEDLAHGLRVHTGLHEEIGAGVVDAQPEEHLEPRDLLEDHLDPLIQPSLLRDWRRRRGSPRACPRRGRSPARG